MNHGRAHHCIIAGSWLLIHVVVVLRYATHCCYFLAMYLMLFISILIKWSCLITPHICHFHHFLVITLMTMNWWHVGTHEPLATSISCRHIYTIWQSILHISCVDLIHVRLALQIRCNNITISMPIIILLLIKIISRYARYVLQIVHTWDLWHLRREGREYISIWAIAWITRIITLIVLTILIAPQNTLVHRFQLL